MLVRTVAPAIAKAKKSVLLLGPRQTGKSTLIKALMPELSINLTYESEFLAFARNPDELPQRLAQAKPATVFIDEIQRLPPILNTIQGLIDDGGKNPIKFYLTGSSARKLKRGQANLLPGRIVQFELSPLTAQELGGAWDEKQALSTGTLPGVYLEETVAERKQILDAYAATYVKEEVQAEALTRDISGFSRFLYVVAARNGEFLDLSKLGSDAGIQRKTASRFFEILEETMLVHRVNAYKKGTYRRLIQHPRFFFFDNGVLNALLGSYAPSADRIGMLFETLVHNQLRAMMTAHGVRATISSYRTSNGAEVDFILSIDDGETWAIEVKASRNVGATDLRGLQSFAEAYGSKHRPVIVYQGHVEKQIDGVLITTLSKLMLEILGTLRN